MLGFDTVHPSVVESHNGLFMGQLVMNWSHENELQKQSHKNKNGVYVKDFLKGRAKNN